MKLNPNIKPFTRIEAATTVHTLLQIAQAKNVDMVKDFTTELEALYKFFAPRVPTQGQNLLDYIARFVADGTEVREYLHYVCVRQGVAYATNGHIAVWGDCDLADGMYHPTLTHPVDIDITLYPDFTRMTPSDTVLGRERCYDLSTMEPETVVKGSESGRFVKLGDSTFDYNLLLKVANGADVLNMRLPKVPHHPAIAFLQCADLDFEPTRILIMPTMNITEK